MSRQYCILSSTAIHCRSLPLICASYRRRNENALKRREEVIVKPRQIECATRSREKGYIYLRPPLPFFFNPLFILFSVPFLFVDVGGQRTQRQKWMQCFDSGI